MMDYILELERIKNHMRENESESAYQALKEALGNVQFLVKYYRNLDKIEKRREEERLSTVHIQHDPEIPCGEAELIAKEEALDRG